MKEGRKYSTLKTETDYADMVKVMFSRIAGRYDFMNHLLSMGLDLRWRKRSLELVGIQGRESFLDLACGTGDLGIFAAKTCPRMKVFAVDFSKRMLSRAVKKVNERKLSKRVTFLAGDAVSLPFRDESFDITGIAFGLRNIPGRENALKEMIRVTKKGGKVMVLEMSIKERVGFLYKSYFRYIMPVLSRIFSEDPDAYLYLYETVSSFPGPEELKDEMEKIGLSHTKIHRFWPGITYLVTGSRF